MEDLRSKINRVYDRLQAGIEQCNEELKGFYLADAKANIIGVRNGLGAAIHIMKEEGLVALEVKEDCPCIIKFPTAEERERILRNKRK